MNISITPANFPCGTNSDPETATNIAVKKLHPNSVLPTRGSPWSAGLDLYACEETVVRTHSALPTLVKTGIAMAIPAGYAGEIWGRSSLECKEGFDHRAGVIDADYRGEILVALINGGIANYRINVGDRIAQMLIVPVGMMGMEWAEELPHTARSDGGFGSTGK